MKDKYPFQDVNLSLEKRLSDLVSRLTVEEKVGLIPTQQRGIPRLGIRDYSVGGEGAHGLVMRDGSPTTVFPQTIGLACSWNPALLQKVGAVVGKEARAYYKARGEVGGLTLWAPTVDLLRDPRWGRTEEAYGEDPYLTSTLAVGFVQGMQGTDPFYLQVGAALKHFFANNNETDRCSCSVSVDPRNMYEYYLQAYRPIVEKGKVCCIMTAYNSINGVPANLNDDVEDVVKKEWGLPGFVVSDAWDFSQIVTHHQYTDSYSWALAQTIKSGVDCIPDEPDLVMEAAHQALEEGLLSQDDLDKAVRNILRIRMRLGQFDAEERNPYGQIDQDAVCLPEHGELALQAQRESIVLLKNRDSTLPLNKDAVSKIAVIGPLAHAVHQDWYTGYAPYTVSILDGIKGKLGAGRVIYASGLDTVALKSLKNGKYVAPDTDGVLRADQTHRTEKTFFEHTDWGWGNHTIRSLTGGKYVTTGEKLMAAADNVYGWFVKELYDFVPTSEGIVMETWDDHRVVIEEGNDELKVSSHKNEKGSCFGLEVVENGIVEAVRTAQSGDVALVCVGSHPLINGKEEVDRPDITLSPYQHKLIQAVFDANPNTVVVVVASYPIALNWEELHIPAMIYTANCCQELGNGVADVLFGDYNPAGRLNMTWPRSVEQLPPLMDYDVIRGGRTYMYFRGSALYPFGHGLSYTQFKYEDLSINKDRLDGEEALLVRTKISNIGDTAGDEVVQLYGSSIHSILIRPKKQLMGFERIFLEPGESKVVEFELDTDRFAVWDVNRERYAVESGFYQIGVGASSEDIRLIKTFWVNGETIGPRSLSNKTKAYNYNDYEYPHFYLDECRAGGTAVRLSADRGWLGYYSVLLQEMDEFAALAASERGGSIELRLDGPQGELIGVCHVPRTGGRQVWQEVRTELKPAVGIRDLYLILHNDVSLGWIQIKEMGVKRE